MSDKITIEITQAEAIHSWKVLQALGTAAAAMGHVELEDACKALCETLFPMFKYEPLNLSELKTNVQIM